MNPLFRYLIRSLVALALATAPMPMGFATAMPATTAMQSAADDHCGCAMDNTDCAQSETCFAKCATAPALEPKRGHSKLFFFAAADLDGLESSQFESVLAPPPLPPPRV